MNTMNNHKFRTCTKLCHIKRSSRR